MLERIPEFIGNHPLLIAAFVTVALLLVAGEWLKRRNGPKGLMPEQAVKLMNAEDAIVIDLRDQADYKKGYIVGARNIPLAKLADRSAELSKSDKPIICYCNAGLQSGKAATDLMAAGIESVYSLKGGITAWRNVGLPVSRK